MVIKMQMFNGITIQLLKNYSVKFDNNSPEAGSDQGSDNYGDKFKELNMKIADLADESNGNDVEARNTLNALLNDEFLNKLDSYLQGNEKLRTELQKTLIKFLNNYNGGQEDNAFKNLIKLAIKLGLKTDTEGKWSTESSENTDSVPEKPTLDFNGSLEGIKAGETGKEQKGSGGLYNGLKRDASDGNETTPDDENLYKTIETINEQLKNVSELLNDDKLKDDKILENVQNGLHLAQTVINYTTTDNVKILQGFISDNLTGEEKTEFDRKSKKNGVFDGKFGKGTLKGMNIILNKTDTYIKNMENYLKKLNQKENKEKFDQITIKDNPTITKVENINNIDYNQLLNVPDGLSGVEFELSAEDKEKLKKPGNQTITLKVKLGDQEKSFNIKVNVTENTSHSEEAPEAPMTPLDTTPYEDNQGKKYQVLDNSQKLSQNTGLQGVTFYSPEEFSGQAPTNGKWETVALSKADENGDFPCLMKLSNGEVYNAKIDKKGNLCPTAINAVSNVPVVMENSASGTAYIENKLPDALKGKCRIRWDGGDYAISLPGGGEYLTIEPMTIDGIWIGNLTDSLAFLNFTNYLRNSGKMQDIEFNNDNPDLKLEGGDLYVRVKKTSNIEGKKIKWLKVNKDTFGLPNDEKLLKKYIRYNNGEDWEDDWDKKKPNKYYKHVKLQ